MSSTRRNARVAGFIYLLLVVAAPYRLLFLPGKLFVSGDAAATAKNIADHELLFRLGIVADLLCGVTVLLLSLALYRLFRGVDRTQAILLVVLGGIPPATIDFLNTVNDGAALALIRGPEYLAAFDQPQRQALAMLFLRLHDHVVASAEILWGLWLFPMAILVWRSGFLPRFVSVWLTANGAAYLASSLSALLVPSVAGTIADLAFPALLGEVAMTLALLFGSRRMEAGDVADPEGRPTQ